MRHISSGLAAVLVFTLMASDLRAQLWWERGADTWYYKDDWKAQAVPGASSAIRIINLPTPASSGWIVVWGDRGYRLSVNGKQIGACIDGGLIDDYDLTPFLASPSAKIELRIDGPADVCAEGEIVARDGQRQAFTTGPGWTDSRGRNLTGRKMAAGRSTGAFDRAHNGRLMSYNDEERGKTAIARAFARIQRLQSQGIFLVRRFRPADQVVSFDPALPWRRVEASAQPLIQQARTMLEQTAVPAQKAGRFAEAASSASEAAALIASAEEPIQLVTDLYRAERQMLHLENCLALVESRTTAPADPQSSPPRLAVAGIRAIDSRARQACANSHWAQLRNILAQMNRALEDGRELIGRSAETAFGRLIGGVGALDEFPEDRFGWLNARELTGNDPGLWPFNVTPVDCDYIDLAGMWDFRIDPDNEGQKQGWAESADAQGWQQLYAPKPWERQGVLTDNRKAPNAPIGRGTTGEDKPYNGFAWYRKQLVIPADWQGKDIIFSVGNVQNWCMVFINGTAVEQIKRDQEERRVTPATSVRIPASLVRFGERNTIAIHVYNHDNFGGIVAGPLALYPRGAAPTIRETPGPMSYTQEYTFLNPADRLTMLASAMSPACIVATGPELNLWGWEAKGYALPDSVEFVSADGVRILKLISPFSRALQEKDLSENWLLLRGRSGNVLLVLETRPTELRWTKGRLGAMQLAIKAGSPQRAIILPLPAAARLDTEACRQWARTLRNYPVAASEVVVAGASLLMQKHILRYSYLAIPGFGPQEPLQAAPVPMLASFALQYNYPGLRIDDAQATQARSQYATYRWRQNSATLTYDAPAVDRSKVMKGFGELFARKRASDNVHGGVSEPAMFQRAAAWGFDHCRYALAFDADWDLPMVSGKTRITDDPSIWNRLDELVANCNKAGVQMMLCWFPEIGSRRWKDHPEWEKTTLEWWRRVAQRYANLPAWAISYDPFNEPAYMNIDHWNQLMKDLTAAIRSVDKTHTIVWESADGWAQPHWCLWMEPVNDPNVLYSFHHYGKHWGYAYDEYYPSYECSRERTQVDPWLEAILFSLKHHVPIHCGEFGLSMIRPAGSAEMWLDDYLAHFERFGIGWNWWNYDGGNIYRTGLAAADRISPFIPILAKWAHRSGQRPHNTN